ncbi:hypothetical protein, partial [Bacteroides sp. RTP31139st1_H2_RTP31139_211217]
KDICLSKITPFSLASLPKGYYIGSVIMYRDLFMTEEEELKARIEAAKKDLSFFSLYWDDIQNTDWISDEELEEGINDCLDDLNDAQDKLNENGSPP